MKILKWECLNEDDKRLSDCFALLLDGKVLYPISIEGINTTLKAAMQALAFMGHISILKDLLNGKIVYEET